MSPKLALGIAVIIIFAAAIAAAEVIDAGREQERARADATTGASSAVDATADDELQGPRCGPNVPCPPGDLPPATGGVQPGEGGANPLRPKAASSWAQFAASMPPEIGVAVVGIGSRSAPVTFGPLQSGHAWSSIKVPIVVALINQRAEEGRELDAEEQAQARAALTASDNDAAASLFQSLEAANGGLDGASRVVSETLNAASSTPTEVATAPPPSGAVSTYGQTDWSLSASAEFFAALDQGCLAGPEATRQVLSLMGEVVPEQQWGLPTASFPPGAALAYKAGWGPEGSAGGSYLVRQTGIVEGDGGGVAVAMMAIDQGGSFEGGVEDLNRIAAWVGENLESPLPSGSSPC